MSLQTTVFPTRSTRSNRGRHVLHAFPQQSEIALCGVTRKQSAEMVVSGPTSRCSRCEQIAGDKWFMGR